MLKSRHSFLAIDGALQTLDFLRVVDRAVARQALVTLDQEEQMLQTRSFLVRW